jgi:hypothetical protein
MPVYQLRAEMSYEEFLNWLSYFEQRPVEWRADDRAAKLLQAQGVKEKPWALFHSLDAIYNSSKADVIDGEVGIAALKGSSVFAQLLTATGGHKLEF